MKDRWYGDTKHRWYGHMKHRWYGPMKDRWYGDMKVKSDRWYGRRHLGGWLLCQFRRCVFVMEPQIDGLVAIVWAGARAREVLTEGSPPPTQ
jgi:hypothetical protein